VRASFATIIISVTAINWFALESLWTKSKVRDGYRVFAAPTGLKSLYFIGIPAFIYGAIVSYFGNPNEKWVSALLLIFAVWSGCFLPATILVSREKVMSLRWFGLQKTQMSWNDVEAVYSNPEENSIIVQDKNQNRIVHTIFNIDREGFIEQVKMLPHDILSKITIQL
jgi:hypothetical protein